MQNEAKILNDLSIRCSEITEAGVYNLSQVWMFLGKMQRLILDFGGCKNIANAALYHLSSQGKKALTDLRVLSLKFNGYSLL